MLVTTRRRVTHLTAAAYIGVHEGVCHLEMRGPITIDTMRFMAREACRDPRWRGLVLDYRKAVLLASDAQLKRLPAHNLAAQDPLRRPGAFICAPDMAERFTLHAFRLALAGLPRRVFSTPEAGHAYVLAESAEAGGDAGRALS